MNSIIIVKLLCIALLSNLSCCVRQFQGFKHKNHHLLFQTPSSNLSQYRIETFLRNDFVRGCYFTNWAQYRDKPYKFLPENINPDLCNVIYFAFAVINHDFELTAFDPSDLDSEQAKGLYQRIVGLKSKNPELKVFLSIGGWTFNDCEDVEHRGASTCFIFSSMASDSKKRETFIMSAIQFARVHGFDGIDLDWEFPNEKKRNGYTPHDDKANFATLVNELRVKTELEALENSAARLWVTGAVGVGRETVENGYDIPKLCDPEKGLDYINLMSYDMHGTWESITGHNAPFRATPADVIEYNQDLSVEWVIDHWTHHGCDPKKLVLGLGTYGRGFVLENSASNHGFLARVKKDSEGKPVPSPPGPATQTPGFLSYGEIKEKLNSGELMEVWDNARGVPYAYNSEIWVGYDNEASIVVKSEYVRSRGLLGAMIWTLDFDDFNDGFPLLRSMNNVLRRTAVAGSEECPAEMPDTGARTSQIVPRFPPGVWDGLDCSSETLRRLPNKCFKSLTKFSTDEEKLACAIIKQPRSAGKFPFGMYPSKMRLDEQLLNIGSTDLTNIFDACALPKLIQNSCFNFMRNSWPARYESSSLTSVDTYKTSVASKVYGGATFSLGASPMTLSSSFLVSSSEAVVRSQEYKTIALKRDWINDFGTLSMESCLLAPELDSTIFNPVFLKLWNKVLTYTSQSSMMQSTEFKILADAGFYVPILFRFAVQFSVDYRAMYNASSISREDVTNWELEFKQKVSVAKDFSFAYSRSLGFAGSSSQKIINSISESTVSSSHFKYGDCRFDLVLKYPKYWSVLLGACANKAAADIGNIRRASYIPDGGFLHINSILERLGYTNTSLFFEALREYNSYCTCDGFIFFGYSCYFADGKKRSHVDGLCVRQMWWYYPR